MISEFKCAPDDADGVVVSLLAPSRSVRNLDERRVAYLMKELFAERGTPSTVQHSQVAHQGCRSEVFLREARLTVGDKFIEYVNAAADSRRAVDAM